MINQINNAFERALSDRLVYEDVVESVIISKDAYKSIVKEIGE